MPKEVKEGAVAMSHQSVNKKIENIKKSNANSRLKSTINKMKYSLYNICVPCTILVMWKTKINCHSWPSRTDTLTQNYNAV